MDPKILQHLAKAAPERQLTALEQASQTDAYKAALAKLMARRRPVKVLKIA